MVLKLIAKILVILLHLFSPVCYYLESKKADDKKSGKKIKESPTFLLMTLNFNIIYLYFLINGIFSNSGKIVSKSETELSSVSKQNPTVLDTFRRFRTEKLSKINGFRGSV